MLSVFDQNSSSSAPSTRPSVPKWPFITGNIVLVLVAVAIWTTAVTLTVGQMMFCLGAVALGAIFSITPFAIEAWPFRPGRSAPGNETAGELPAAGGENDWRRQSRAAAEAVEHAARANAALENSARRFDARFAPLVEIHKNLEAVVTDLREAATNRQTAAAAEAQSAQRELERLRKDQAEKFKSAEIKIAVLEETLGRLAAHVQTLADRPAPVAVASPQPERIRIRQPAPVRAEVPMPEPVAAAPVVVAEPVLVAAGVGESAAAEATFLASSPTVDASQPEAPILEEAKALAPAPEPVEAPAVERAPVESTRMMDRAFAQTRSSSETPAVAGIIMARARRPRKTRHPLPETPVTAQVDIEPPVPAPISLTDRAEPPDAPLPVEAPVTAAAEITSASPAMELPTEGETASELRRNARAKALALRGEEDEEIKKNTPIVFSPPRADEPGTAAPVAGPTQGELLAREADTIRRKRASRNPLNACSLTANVLIGIGNKPFVRGAGPGLNPDKGVPMEFVEIGQWRWVAPSVGKESITLRIFKNDEVPADGDPIILRPGQTLEVSPVFPGAGA